MYNSLKSPNGFHPHIGPYDGVNEDGIEVDFLGFPIGKNPDPPEQPKPPSPPPAPKPTPPQIRVGIPNALVMHLSVGRPEVVVDTSAENHLSHARDKLDPWAKAMPPMKVLGTLRRFDPKFQILPAVKTANWHRYLNGDAKALNERGGKGTWIVGTNFPALPDIPDHKVGEGLFVGIVYSHLGLVCIDVDKGGSRAVGLLRAKYPGGVLLRSRKFDGFHYILRVSNRSGEHFGNKQWQMEWGEGDIRYDGGYAILWEPVKVGELLTLAGSDPQFDIEDVKSGLPDGKVGKAKVKAASVTESLHQLVWNKYIERSDLVHERTAAGLKGQCPNTDCKPGTDRFWINDPGKAKEHEFGCRKCKSLIGIVQSLGIVNEESLLLQVRSYKTESDLAHLFTFKYASTFKHVNASGDWYILDDTGVWNGDDRGVSIDRMRRIADRAGVKDLKSISRARGALKLAGSTDEQSVVRSDFDKDAWHVGCPSGVLSLKSGNLVSAAEGGAYQITKRLGGVPGGEFAGSLWEQVLREWMEGEEERMSYLQRLTGYCLKGNPTEQKFHVFTGEGGNGKSVFIDTIIAAFGDYGKTMPIENFLIQRYDRHDSVANSLEGMRLITSGEPPKKRKFDVEFLKTLTGEKSMSGRYLHTSTRFEFPIRFNLVFACNDVPSVTSLGHSVRRRMRCIPWNFKPEVPDVTLRERLESDELSIVLKWIIDGIELYENEGLEMPDAFLDKTEEYFADQEAELRDPVQHFIEDMCITGDALKAMNDKAEFGEYRDRTRASDLYTAFGNWYLEEYGRKVDINRNVFGRRLSNAGCRSEKKNGVQRRIGIVLASQVPAN